MKLIPAFAVCAAVASLALAPACEDKKAAAPAPAPGSTPADDHGHEHADQPAATGHGGAVVQLGTATIGAFNVTATRDEGAIVAGKDAPIDVTVTPSAGSDANVTAVRFWIGTEDAMGSVKARAEVENPAEPNRWHTHAELPDPLPEGSRLWVEIEDAAGKTTVGGFDLKG